MVKIIEFPSPEKQFDKYIHGVICKHAGNNNELQKYLEAIIIETNQILNDLNTEPYVFDFNHKNDSIHENIGALSEAAQKLADSYNKKIFHLLGLLIEQKIEIYKATHIIADN